MKCVLMKACELSTRNTWIGGGGSKPRPAAYNKNKEVDMKR